jgi:hypothetical protein
MSDLSREEKKIKTQIDLLLEKCEKLNVNLRQKLDEFSVTQYDHFLNIRRDIDIQRESLLVAAHSEKNTNKILSDKELKLIVDNINEQSVEMIKRVEKLEGDFRANFNLIAKSKSKNVFMFEIDAERMAMKEFFAQANLKLENVRKLKMRIENLANDMMVTLNNFKLFEYDLMRNR